MFAARPSGVQRTRRLRSWAVAFCVVHGGLFELIAAHGVTGHFYADDSQMSVHRAVDVESTVSQLMACL